MFFQISTSFYTCDIERGFPVPLPSHNLVKFYITMYFFFDNSPVLISKKNCVFGCAFIKETMTFLLFVIVYFLPWKVYATCMLHRKKKNSYASKHFQYFSLMRTWIMIILTILLTLCLNKKLILPTTNQHWNDIKRYNNIIFIVFVSCLII